MSLKVVGVFIRVWLVTDSIGVLMVLNVYFLRRLWAIDLLELYETLLGFCLFVPV